MDKKELPSIILTGASGFLGKYFLEIAKENYNIFAFARRNQARVGVKPHPNIQWILVDIANEIHLAKVMKNIKNKAKITAIVHLAAYYDFGNERNPEYERTNIFGTKLILQHAKELGIKHFIFASSVAASNFPRPEGPITEKTPLDAKFPYAVSKREGEKMVKEYSQYFKCSVVRFAAIFSDWCEYGPLYVFLNTWFSKSYKSRILGGNGESAVPYVFVKCVVRLLVVLLDTVDQHDQYDCFIAGADGSTSHNELFNLSTRLFYGKQVKSLHMPKFLSSLGVRGMDLFGRLIGKRPFERPWMMFYIDKKLDIDSSYTREKTGWRPCTRHHISRRLLYLITHMKSFPNQWHQLNLLALRRPTSVSDRPNLFIAEQMQVMQEEIINQVTNHFYNPANRKLFLAYQNLYEPQKVKYYLEIVYNLLVTSVRNGDRFPLVNYAKALARVRKEEGVSEDQLLRAFKVTGDMICEYLLKSPETKKMEMLVHDSIKLTVRLAMDAIEDTFAEINREEKAAENKKIYEC